MLNRKEELVRYETAHEFACWAVCSALNGFIRNGRYAAAGVGASCASGLHTYRAIGVGVMKDTDGGTYFSEKFSRTRRTTCPGPD